MLSRSCVVTGAAGGIGREIIRALLTQGWGVVAIDQSFVEQSPSSAVDNVAYVRGDVASRKTQESAADAAIKLAPLRGWVNCAGYNILGSVAVLETDALKRGVDVNLLGVFHGTGEAVRRFLPADAQSGQGAVVNISSIQGSVGFPGFAAYAMCKGGIDALTRQVAAEYAGSGVRCNAVAPGLIHTAMNDRLLADSADASTIIASWNTLTPVGRWGQPEDVATVVAFLLDDAMSGFITGEVIHVDGGARALARGQVSWSDRIGQGR